MYEVNGVFGQVRHVPTPFGEAQNGVPFTLTAAGWHKCNDLYHIYRENGADSHLLLFALSDGGCITVGDNDSFSLPKNAVAWLPPNIRHDYRTKRGGQWEMYWIHLPESPLYSFSEIFRERSWIPLSCMDGVQTAFESMLQDRTTSAAAFSIRTSHIISDLYHLLLQESSHAEQAADDKLIRQILRDMEASYQEPWRLEQMSAAYFLSVPQLIRRFKAETGLTPHACLTQIRLRAAELYLSYTLLSVEEIARKTGFPGISNFIQQYRKAYGTTPHQYRSKK